MKIEKERQIVSRDLELGLRKNRVVTPSNIDIWFGNWIGNDHLTQQQRRELLEAGLDPEATETIDVFIRTTHRQLWVPESPGGRKDYPWRQIRCPVVGRRLDGRVKVIAPMGDRKLVWPDGSINRPQAKNRRSL